MTKPSRRPAILAFILLMPAACGGSAATASLDVATDTVGDTITVRNLAGSLRGVLDLVTEVRIGTIDGAEEEIFGMVTGLAVADDGTIYVYDRQVPALRAYGADGRFVRTIGRKGSGPGEYANSDGGLAVLSDGSIVLRDPGNARFNAYHPDGSLARNWPGRGGFFTSAPLVADREDRLHSMVFRNVDKGEKATAGSLWITRVLRMAADGTPLDTLDIPDFGFEAATIVATREGGTSMNNVPFTASHSWAVRRDGSIIAGVGSQYAFYVFRRDGSVLRIEREAERVPVAAAERKDAEDRATVSMRMTDPGWRWNGPPVPDVKPAFSRVYAGADDRIWVLVPQPAEAVEVTDEEQQRSRGPNQMPPERFREPIVFDVFEPDGRYFGRVHAPKGFVTYPTPVFRGDNVWAVVKDELDVSYVVRFRIDQRMIASGTSTAYPSTSSSGAPTVDPRASRT